MWDVPRPRDLLGRDQPGRAPHRGYNPTNTISAIELTCTTGTKLMMVGNINNKSTGGTSCGNGTSLVQGFDVWSGTLIDAIAPRCDDMFNTANADFIGTKRGGSGGGKSTMQCPEGTYLVGMRTYNTGTVTSTTDTRFINGTSLVCRETTVP